MLNDTGRDAERTEDHVISIVATPPLSEMERNQLCALLCGNDG